MDIVLDREEVQVFPATLRGDTKFSLTAGGRIRIQNKPQGGETDDLLDEVVPAGKVWSVTIDVSIIENDA